MLIENVGRLKIEFHSSSLQCVENVVRNMLPMVKNLWIGNDLQTALACLDVDEFDVKAIVIAGTGSCCYGTNGKDCRKIGGFGHRIGELMDFDFCSQFIFQTFSR